MAARRLKQKTKIDKLLFAIILSLIAIGLVSILDVSTPYALSYFDDKYYFFKQQAVWSAVGLTVLVITSLINYKVWRKYSTVLFGLSVTPLVLVLVPGLGVSTLGARRWLSLGPINLQPTELVKLGMILYFSSLADSNKGMRSYMIPLVGMLGLIMLQPDLGSSISLTIAGMSQIFVSGVSLFHFAGYSLAGILLAVPLVVFSDYRRARLLTFFKQSSDPLGSAYHIRQILLALGSGGLFGVGLGQSRQKHLFLPETATDSIFAVIGEEIGFIGAMVIIILFGILFYRVVMIAKGSPDTFAKVFAVGFLGWVGGQMILNVGSMVALIPLTGVPLPFISYGGSSLITLMVATGILLNISRFTRKSNARKR